MTMVRGSGAPAPVINWQDGNLDAKGELSGSPFNNGASALLEIQIARDSGDHDDNIFLVRQDSSGWHVFEYADDSFFKSVDYDEMEMAGLKKDDYLVDHEGMLTKVHKGGRADVGMIRDYMRGDSASLRRGQLSLRMVDSKDPDLNRHSIFRKTAVDLDNFEVPTNFGVSLRRK